MGFLTPSFIISILIALTVHEAAHAFVAYRLGDSTAKYLGRMTLNPLAHLDPMGTVLFLIVGFGWGKPVPVDPSNFAHPKRDNAMVALAGPVSNLLLAVIGYIGLDLSGQEFFADFLFINLALMAFNLLPVAPLDGSKVLGMFIPYQYEDAYDNLMRQGPILLLVLIIAERIVNFPFLNLWVRGIVEATIRMFGILFGWL